MQMIFYHRLILPAAFTFQFYLLFRLFYFSVPQQPRPASSLFLYADVVLFHLLFKVESSRLILAVEEVKLQL